MKEDKNIEFVVVPNNIPKKKSTLIIVIAVSLAFVLIASCILAYVMLFRIPERDRTIYSSTEIVDDSRSWNFDDGVYWIITGDSKKIKVIGYEYSSKIMLVCYRGKDTFDYYLHIPEKEWNNIISANFFDRYFEKNVKENYIHSRSSIKCKIEG